MKKVFLIGAGPGDPDLLTLKAVRALEESEAILYDHLVNPEILRHCSKKCEFHFVGKSKGDHTLTQDEINALIIELSKKYNVVSRVKGGDPYIFGRGGEEYEYVLEHGIDCDVIPGITSASGASTSCHIPLTHRDYASEVIFMTGHKKKDEDYLNFRSLDLNQKTYVIYMAVTSVNEIMDEIMKKPENKNVPAAVIEKATRKNERVFAGTVETISDIVKEKNVRPPALLIVGEVVKFYTRVNELRSRLEGKISSH